VAGHVHIGDRVFISGGVVIHQFTHIGRLAMCSGNARVSLDVAPFTLAAERNEIHALNLVGLRRAKIPVTAISELKRLFKLAYLSGLTGTQALAAMSPAGLFQTVEAQEFIEFIRQSPNGLCPGPRR
ncbi:MAG: acyl-ACP--UDP-N-acetylglucosamine O-acyltransferase, partial [Verrucomicrobiota bacterium]